MVPQALAKKAKAKPKRRRRDSNKPKEKSELPIHQRCHHEIEGLAKGQACPECERGKLYKYEPALVFGHAGEWLDELLSTRAPTAPPLVMSDALSSNRPSVIVDYHQLLCNTHARREFVEVIAHFPDQVEWVLERYSHIWLNNTYCQEHQFTGAQRLAYHQTHSLPVMEQIRDWGQKQLDHGTVEANSGLGQAIAYFQRHFEGLTAFCRLENAPIDNNALEQALKLIIRGRKNALFFKTPAGAAIADVITSVVATAEQAGINAFDYLVALQRHQQAVRGQPEQWLPWNYHIALEQKNAAAAEKKAA